MTKVGRNDSCPCGSGKKYKKCCEEKVKHKKFQAQVLSSSAGTQSPATQQASQVSSLFFKKAVSPSVSHPKEEPKNPVM